MKSLSSNREKSIWKLTGGIERMSLNGRDFFDMLNLSNKTLYTSPYMVITDQEYTKHYYAGSERIASKLGGGFELASVNPTDDNHDLAPITSYTSIPEFYDQKKADLMELLGHSWDCVNMQGYASLEGEQLLSIEELQNSNNPENEMFFYHTDHLGSSSWITDASGEAYQHLQNMPFGEQFINQRQSSWGAVYQFTGYEKDPEIKPLGADSRTPLNNEKWGEQTGFDYAHARYYCSELSIFLSVDPMDYKYPSTSGYMYVGGNPIMITDPTGMDWYQDADGNYIHDKNVTKDTKLDEGEKYLGKSKIISVKDTDGKEQYQIGLNEDGSMTDKMGVKHKKGFGEYDAKFKSGHKIISNKQESKVNYAKMLETAIPVAISIEASGSAESGGASSATPYGGILIFRGNDAWSYVGYTAANVGVGWLGASATGSLTTYYYYGNLDNFGINSFSGWSSHLQISAGELLIGGGHVNIVRDINGGYLFGIGPDVGFGVGSPVSGQLTRQYTIIHE